MIYLHVPRFSEVGRIPKAFSSMEYIGTRTKNPPTNFRGLLESVNALLKNNAVRAPRTLAIILKALQVYYMYMHITVIVVIITRVCKRGG